MKTRELLKKKKVYYRPFDDQTVFLQGNLLTLYKGGNEYKFSFETIKEIGKEITKVSLFPHFTLTSQQRDWLKLQESSILNLLGLNASKAYLVFK